MTETHIFGLELGGTKCIALRADERQIIDSVAISTTEPGATLSAVDEVFESWRRERRPDALGIASFGPVAVDRRAPAWGSVLKTPKRGWTGTDIAGRYRRLLEIPIGFDTDVNAAALAEARWGSATDTSCSAYITVGTGIGVGIVANGAPVHGWLHPEFGHLRARRMPGDDFAGTCPFHGDCIEGLISGPAIAARSGMPGGHISDDHPLWSQVAHDLGELVAGLLLAVSPQRIALGGGVACGRPWLVDRTRQAVITSLGGYFEDLPANIETMVTLATLGNQAGPLGAIALGLAVREEDAF